MISIDHGEKPPYLRMAFHNGFNYLLMLGAVGGAFASNNWWPLVVGAAVEVAWLFLAPRAPVFRSRFDRKIAGERKEIETAHQQELLRTLGEEDRRRFLDLDRLRQEIHKLSASNPSFAFEMVRGELDKLDRLIGSFLNIASAAGRYETYVASTDLNTLESDVRRQEAVIEKTTDPDSLPLAQKNLELLERRFERATEIRRQLKGARGQLNLIENTIRLLRDQIVTMESPQELSGQLDDLLGSIDSIESSEKETEALMRGIEPERQAATH